MIEEDRRPFSEMIGATYDFYKRDITPPILELWWESLAGFDLAAIRGALSRHFRNPDAGQFIPKPADVIRELGGTTADASMLAWALVVRTLARIGSYESVTFDDPITNRVLHDLGGWSWLGTNLTDKEAPFMEKRFRDAYRAWRHRGLVGTELVQRLPGIFEMHNGFKGYKITPPKLIGHPSRAGLIARGELALVDGWEQKLVRIAEGGGVLEHKP